MNKFIFNIQHEIPIEFLNSINNKKLNDFLLKEGCEEFAIHTNGLFILNAVAEKRNKSMLKILQDFGWGKCQTCSFKSQNPHEIGELSTFCYKLHYDFNADAFLPDDFGCIHYQYRSAK